jgi:hypothetical protein
MTPPEQVQGRVDDGPGDIIPSLSIEALLARRDAAVSALERIRDAASEYATIGEALTLGVGYDGPTAQHKWGEPLGGGRHDALPPVADEKWFERSKKTVDAALWEHLLALSGLRTFLDAQAKRDWSEAIEKLTAPELTAANIRETFRELHGRRGEFFERGVVKLFRRLSWDYKTNKPQRFGKRIILKYVIDAYGFASQTTCEALDDLIRAFHLLDKQPEPDHRQGIYRALSAGLDRKPREWSNAYLHIRTFKNGNGHLTFLREDLVQELNLVLHKHHPNSLPPEIR